MPAVVRLFGCRRGKSEGAEKRGPAATSATGPPSISPAGTWWSAHRVGGLSLGQPAGHPRRYHLSGVYSNIPLDHLLPKTGSHPLPNGQPVPISSRASSPAALRQHDPIQTHPDNSPSPFKINPFEKRGVNRNLSQTVCHRDHLSESSVTRPGWTTCERSSSTSSAWREPSAPGRRLRPFQPGP